MINGDTCNKIIRNNINAGYMKGIHSAGGIISCDFEGEIYSKSKISKCLNTGILEAEVHIGPFKAH